MWAASRVLEAAGALATENTEGGIGAEVPVTESPQPLTSAQGNPASSSFPWLGAGKELLVPDLSLYQSTLLRELNGLGSVRTSGRDYFPGPPASGLTIQAAAAVEPIQRGWNKRGGPRAVVESNRPNH